MNDLDEMPELPAVIPWTDKPRKDNRGIHFHKHGRTKTPEHKIWVKMNERCYSPSATNFERYGGRGINVCDEWRTDFMTFLRDMGPRPSPEYSLERRDNSKGYSKDNCKWATLLEQMNNKRDNVLLSFQGRIQSVAAWCRELGLNYHITRQRIYRNKWSAERALTATTNQSPHAKH